MPLAIDYLVLRYLPGDPTIRQRAWLSPDADLTLSAGKLYAPPDMTSLGGVAYKHGATLIHLKGEFWRRRPYPNADARLLHQMLQEHTRSLASDELSTVTVPRVDYVQEAAPPALVDAAFLRRIADLIQLPGEPCHSFHASDDGITLYKGIRGNDPAAFRSRSHVLRVYQRTGANIRIELELKGLGTHAMALDDQLSAYWTAALEAFSPFFGELKSPAPPAPELHLHNPNVVRHSDAGATFARIAGSVLRYAERQALYLPPEALDALRVIRRHLGANPNTKEADIVEFQRAQARALDSGTALNTSDPDNHEAPRN